MANIKSQIKRNRQNEKRRLRNRKNRGSARVAVRNARAAMDSGNAEESGAAVLKAVSELDKASSKGVLHNNNAARRKGRLMKRLAALNFEFKPGKAEQPKAEEAGTKKKPAKKAATKNATKKSATEKTSAGKTKKKASSKKKT